MIPIPRRNQGRRRLLRGQSLALLACVSTLAGRASAQDQATPPPIDVQHFQPVEDGRGWLATRSPTPLDTGRLGFGVWFHVATDPLTYRAASGERTDVVGRLMTLDLQGAVGLGVADLGVDLPLHLLVDGDGLVGWSPPMHATALGDLRLVPKVRLLDARRRGGFGLGLAVPVTLPTGNEATFVGTRTVTATPSLLVLGDLGRVRLGGNLGVRLAGVEEVLDTTSGTAMEFRAAVGVDALDALGFTAEVFGDVRGAGNANPVEWLAGVDLRPTDGLSLRLAGGTAIGPGIGAPRGRIVVAASIVPRRKERATVAVEEEPTPATRHLELHSDQAAWVQFPHPYCATLDVLDGRLAADIPAEIDHVEVGAPGFRSREVQLGAPGADAPLEVRLEPAEGRGWLVLSVVHDGDPVPGALVGIDGQEPRPADDGRLAVELPAGPVTVTVTHPDHRDETLRLRVRDGCCTFARAELRPAPVWFPERVYFDVGRTELRPEADPVLRAVAERALARPDAGTLTIVGMADPRGSEEINRALCEGRAEVVRRRLIQLGVPGERLEVAIEPPREGAVTADEELQNMRRVEFRLEMTGGEEDP